MKKVIIGVLVALILSCTVYAQEGLDMASVIEKQRQELIQKEEILKRETERLKIISQNYNEK